MARTATGAVERRKQRAQAKAEAEAAVGKPLSTSEVAQWHRTKKGGVIKESPLSVRRLSERIIDDRVVPLTDDEVTHIGRILGKVVDMKTVGSGQIYLNVTCPVEFAHLAVDAIRISRNHALIIDLSQLYIEPDGTDDDE